MMMMMMMRIYILVHHVWAFLSHWIFVPRMNGYGIAAKALTMKKLRFLHSFESGWRCRSGHRSWWTWLVHSWWTSLPFIFFSDGSSRYLETSPAGSLAVLRSERWSFDKHRVHFWFTVDEPKCSDWSRSCAVPCGLLVKKSLNKFIWMATFKGLQLTPTDHPLLGFEPFLFSRMQWCH